MLTVCDQETTAVYQLHSTRNKLRATVIYYWDGWMQLSRLQYCLVFTSSLPTGFLYRSFVKPHLEYCIVAYSLLYITDEELIGKNYRRVARMIPDRWIDSLVWRLMELIAECHRHTILRTNNDKICYTLFGITPYEDRQRGMVSMV